MSNLKSVKHKIPYNNLKPAFELAHFEIHEAFVSVYDSSNFILGTKVKQFEEALAKATGFKHAIGVASGTDALTLSLIAAGITNGKKVLTVANSAPATVLAIRRAGAIPIYADIRRSDGIIDFVKLTTERLREANAFMPVHLYGRVAEPVLIENTLSKLGTFVVEDACQAYGSFSPRYRMGSSSKHGAVCLSFYPTKNLGAMGDGGAILTNDETLYHDLTKLRNYGLSEDKINTYGLNSRLDELQAAILLARMKTIDEIATRKVDIGNLYADALSGLEDYTGLIEPEIGDNGHILAMYCEDRNHLRKYLEQHGIGTRVHYPVMAHRQPAEASWMKLANTDELAERQLSIPNWFGMTDEDVIVVAKLVRRFYGK